MIVNVGEAKTQLSQLIARAEAGEDVEIARNGRSAVRLVPVVEPDLTPGQRLLAAWGSLRDSTWVADDAETDHEILEMFDPELGVVSSTP